MDKLIKVYAVTFLKYTSALRDTVWDEEHDKYLNIGHETFLVKEHDLAKYKSYGGGYRSIDYVGNIFEEEGEHCGKDRGDED